MDKNNIMLGRNTERIQNVHYDRGLLFLFSNRFTRRKYDDVQTVGHEIIYKNIHFNLPSSDTSR